jgi:hypothetical protein
MKPLQKFLRTGALVAGLLGATAVPVLAGASPAVAATAYGSGAAVQKSIQSTWISGWTPPTGDSITYTPTTSAGGFNEFGNENSKLDITQDPTASPLEILDGYTAVDSPTTLTQVEKADTAAGTGAQPELSLPVAQVSEVIELNYPSGITLNSGQNLKLTNKLAEEIFAGTVPANAPYNENTWGALLKDSGLTVSATTPPASGSFFDSGTSGGTTGISQVLRTDGAGATLVFKQYLEAVASALGNKDWSGIPIDPNTETQKSGEWPAAGTVSSRQTSDSLQASTVAGTPGLVGYGTLGAAITAGFTDTPGTGTPQNHKLWAWVQDNGVGTTGVRYADPEITAVTNNGGSNVYFGSSVNISGSYTPGSQTGAGNWLVPGYPTLNTTGQWTTASDYTHGWDYDVYVDAGASTNYYPIDIVLWDLTWDSTAWETGKLNKPFYPVPKGSKSVEETVSSYFKYVTSTTGQAATITPHFAPLPTGGTPPAADIRADAAAIAAAI